jgi:hypothetical protein
VVRLTAERCFGDEELLSLNFRVVSILPLAEMVNVSQGDGTCIYYDVCYSDAGDQEITAAITAIRGHHSV